MNITEELNQLIEQHGSARDALNVTLAQLRRAENEILVLKEAAEQSVYPTDDGRCSICNTSKSEHCKIITHGYKPVISG